MAVMIREERRRSSWKRAHGCARYAYLHEGLRFERGESRQARAVVEKMPGEMFSARRITPDLHRFVPTHRPAVASDGDPET
jgi:hypothetical protein